MRRTLRAAARAAGLILAVGVIVVAAFPTRTYLDQRESTSRAEQRLAVLQKETTDLRERAESLDSDREIERLARSDHGLVMPGEEAYIVMPPPLPPVDLPEMWVVGDPDGVFEPSLSPEVRIVEANENPVAVPVPVAEAEAEAEAEADAADLGSEPAD